MKKYLFGLGAMLVGAGLMFVLIYEEVGADSKPEVPERFVCSDEADMLSKVIL
jgi:NAD(P)H-hydrate repair Nnr-like enzyme with NAD(P)H-hydrate dehydratase domain